MWFFHSLQWNSFAFSFLSSSSFLFLLLSVLYFFDTPDYLFIQSAPRLRKATDVRLRLYI